jgi:hypothetical protein
LETANLVKQAIGDPVAAIALIDNGLFSDFLQDSGITDTLIDLAGIAQEGVQLSATIQELFQPIDMSAWANLSSDALVSFEGSASFRDSSDPLKRFRAVENAYSRLEILIGKAQNKRRTLNLQIARLNSQLKNASDDAEVQKLVGSLATAQSALDDIDYVSDSAHRQVEMLHVLNQNRQVEEEVAAEEISRKRNRELAQLAAKRKQPCPTSTNRILTFHRDFNLCSTISTTPPAKSERCSCPSRSFSASSVLEKWDGARVLIREASWAPYSSAF